jgi:putative flippase GtrA
MALINKWAQAPFVRFGMVGVVGFAVDAGVLQALVAWGGWGPLVARGISFPVAVLATWLLNRQITFAMTDKPPLLRSLGRYVLVSLGGASVNFVVYGMLVSGFTAMATFPVLPLAIASVVALVVNYLGSKYFAFR